MKYSMFIAMAASCATSAFAQHQGDIILANIASRLTTGSAISGGGFDFTRRVFVSELGVAYDNFADNPGIDTLVGAFQPRSQIGFRIRKALRKWDGVAFSAIPPERIEMAFGPLGPVLTPISDTVVPGFTLQVGSNGEFHRHYEFTLVGNASDGLYLLELEFFTSVASIADSKPYWIIFNQHETPEEVQAAFAWSQTHLAGCPADFNHDGAVDFFDYDDFVTCFEGGTCPPGSTADFNSDIAIDFFDYDDFVTAFEMPCA